MNVFVSVEAYVKSMGQPELLDLLAQPTGEDVTMEDADDSRPSKRKLVYLEVMEIIILCLQSRIWETRSCHQRSVVCYIVMLFFLPAA